MVNTKEMLPDEYSHYVLRYSMIQSGCSGYNLDATKEGWSEFIAAVLRNSAYEMANTLMDDLENMNEIQRIKVLDYFVERIEREDFIQSSGTHGRNVGPRKLKKSATKSMQIVESNWD